MTDVSNVPRVLGNRYEIGDLIGRGGMAQVHLGYDTRLSRTVAIKVLRTDLAADPMFLARFRREAQSAAALNHPSIVSVYDTGGQVDEATGVVVPWCETAVAMLPSELLGSLSLLSVVMRACAPTMTV